MGFTRRKLLVGCAAGGLGVGAATYGLSLGGPASGSLLLTAEELTIVEAVAEVMFPGAPMPVDGIEAGVAAEVDRIVSEVMDETHATAFRYVLRTLEWGTAASRGSRFSELPVEERRAVLETWSEPEVMARRVAGDSLKAVLGMAYFSNPVVLSAIGWRTGCGGTAT